MVRAAAQKTLAQKSKGLARPSRRGRFTAKRTPPGAPSRAVLFGSLAKAMSVPIAVDPAQAPLAHDRPGPVLGERRGEGIVPASVENDDVDAVLAFQGARWEMGSREGGQRA